MIFYLLPTDILAVYRIVNELSDCYYVHIACTTSGEWYNQKRIEKNDPNIKAVL
jgi:hypothetical protein